MSRSKATTPSEIPTIALVLRLFELVSEELPPMGTLIALVCCCPFESVVTEMEMDTDTVLLREVVVESEVELVEVDDEDDEEVDWEVVVEEGLEVVVWSAVV